MSDDYKPNSLNAVLSRIETKIEEKAIKDAERWQRMEMWMEQHTLDCAEKGRRVSALENWRWYVIGICVGVSGVIAWLVKK